MDLEISGKVALITGSNRGIGKATAITLSKEGVNIALLARNEDLLIETKNEISKASSDIKVEYFICDTKDNEQVRKTVLEIEKEFGKIDILVNCAAALPEESTLDLERDLKLWVRKQIGPIATPDLIQFSPGLPKTRSGKIMRRILRKIAANEHDQLGDTTTLADPSVVDSLVENRKNK